MVTALQGRDFCAKAARPRARAPMQLQRSLLRKEQLLLLPTIDQAQLELLLLPTIDQAQLQGNIEVHALHVKYSCKIMVP